MAPKRGQSLERTPEREEFMKKLAEYHDKRGTTLDPEPKVGIRHIDLFKLYKRVVGEGGYDLVSDTKAKPLMWRRLAEEFIGKNQYLAAQAFQIKNCYYKNLVAYEISTHWQKEPPPKEILEEVTAKGGNVMSRTLDNFERPKPREQERLEHGEAGEASPEQKTPKAEDKTESAEDPGSATGGRSTRGLRQQPPQRVLFQPEPVSSRRARGDQSLPAHLHSHPSPTPTGGASINGITSSSHMMNGTSSTLASYEPSQAYPLSLKPVVTPANNPEFYRNERKRKLEANAGPLAKKYKNIMLPGTGFIGPNIYLRAQLALQSGIPDEEQYALHHLVKISHERGDKYRFDQFPGLADALAKKVLQVTSLFYDINWDVMYDEEFFAGDDETLNGLDGTPDIIHRIQQRIATISDDTVLDSAFLSQLNRITEAGLVIRNMTLQDENAAYLARLPLARDLIAVVLHMPNHPSIIELRHYVLDISEQILRYLDVSPQDAVYQGLLRQVDSSDRGAVATALRTISRIAMTHPVPKKLDDVPTATLHCLQNYLLIDDEELRSAVLEFLGQYTSFADNVENLVQSIDAEGLARQLSRLVLFTAKEHREQHMPKRTEVNDPNGAVPRLSRSIVENLLKLEEPERSSEWLRMCFMADSTTEVTQIALWQAYQGTFAPYSSTHPHLIAGDFIKNVSSTFSGASAQVAMISGSSKYVIKGIRARKVPIDTGALPGSKASDKGKEFHRCYWRMTVPVEGTRNPVTGVVSAPTTVERECAEWFKSPETMLQHILNNHLQLPRKPATAVDGDKMDVDPKTPGASATPSNGIANGTSSYTFASLLDLDSADKTNYRCRWGECGRTSSEFDAGKVSRALLFARHVETHIPDIEPSRSKNNLKPNAPTAAQVTETFRLNMLEDENRDATGVPLRAVIVLRNLARFMPKSVQASNAGKGAVKSGHKQEDKTDLMANIFDDEVREQMFYAFSYSKSMREYVTAVLKGIKTEKL